MSGLGSVEQIRPNIEITSQAPKKVNGEEKKAVEKNGPSSKPEKLESEVSAATVEVSGGAGAAAGNGADGGQVPGKLDSVESASKESESLRAAMMQTSSVKSAGEMGSGQSVSKVMSLL